jgi:hypothetical protein
MRRSLNPHRDRLLFRLFSLLAWRHKKDMSTRILLAGLLGGIVMFIWTSIAHMALPLGEAGVKEIPADGKVIMALQSSLGATSGFYIYPGTGLAPTASRQEKNEAMKLMATKVANGPSGILVYHPTRTFAFGRWLTVEFLTELVEAMLAVFLLAQTRLASFGSRVIFIFILGVVAAIATNVSYWNWYGFPSSYTISYIATETIGFLCVGFTAAFLLRKRPLPATE